MAARPRWTDDELQRIFDRTNGRCHICGGGLCFSNYNVQWARGGWEVEHSVPVCKGGTHRLYNLYAAHIDCNRSKGASSTRTARAAYRRTTAPLSAARRDALRSENALWLGIAGFLLFSAKKPVGRLIAGVVSGAIAYHVDPED